MSNKPTASGTRVRKPADRAAKTSGKPAEKKTAVAKAEKKTAVAKAEKKTAGVKAERKTAAETEKKSVRKTAEAKKKPAAKAYKNTAPEAEKKAPAKTAKKNAAKESNKGTKKSEASGSVKKPAARTGKKAAKNAKKPVEIKPTIKTPQVLKLLEQDKSAANNAVIMAGKSRIPRILSGREPLSRIMKREMGEVFSDIEDTVVVNLTQLAIEYEAPEILDRFNACSCEKCVEVFSCTIAKRVPARFARVTKGADLMTGGRGSRELMERMEPVRKKVITEMIKELICNKKRCFHDDDNTE